MAHHLAASHWYPFSSHASYTFICPNDKHYFNESLTTLLIDLKNLVNFYLIGIINFESVHCSLVQISYKTLIRTIIASLPSLESIKSQLLRKALLVKNLKQIVLKSWGNKEPCKGVSQTAILLPDEAQRERNPAPTLT